MSPRPTLLAEIQHTVGSLAPGYLAAAGTSDVFEAYVLSVLLEAARDEGGTVTFENVDGSRASTLTFRTSAGDIFSDRRPYSHAVLIFPGKPVLEAHLGIFVSGKSGVLHECDVAVVFREEALLCRTNRVAPRASKVLIAAECKFYASDLPLGLARSFLGLIADVREKNRLFVANTGSASIEKLLSHRNSGWEHNIVPGSTTVSRLRHAFRNGFKNFKATS